MLVVHRAAGGTALAGALAEVLAAPLEDPFASEVVAVPAKGVERWLAQRLSHVLGAPGGDGVCANVLFPSPARLLDEVLQAASAEHVEAVERWSPRRSAWALLDVVDACSGEPWCRTLAQHLGSGSTDRGRRVVVVQRLARLFDDYAQSRPQMLRAWAQGRDERGDGLALDADLHWQPELWRRLRAHLAVPSPAELLDDACARLVADPSLSDLPARVSLYGASRLSPARLAVLDALARHRDVHLWLHHASPALWAAGAAGDPPVRRADDRARASLRNPLLASLSRDLLELQQLLRRASPGARDELHAVAPPPHSLLGRLVHDLATDTVPEEPAVLAADDRSVQVHACHGRTRQVEVLREVVLGLLADDPTLEPRDVLVMCPDIETFAPLIAAAFSLGAEDDAAHPAARLRVRLADRALRQTNPLFSVLGQLLELGGARVTATQVLDLAGSDAVRRRFGFDDDEVERLRAWTAAAGVRWGIDSEHRGAWALGGLDQGTWRVGLDRLLLGAAVQDSTGWGTTTGGGTSGGSELGGLTPLDDVDSADIDLAGRFAELLDRLEAALELLTGSHPVAEWMAGLESAVLGLAAPAPDAAWQELALHGELADIAQDAAGATSLVGLADVRAALQRTLAGRPTRASFRTGTMTVCTLVPMRSVPHRVVCLLGLDDGVFPRQTVRDGDDVLARDPWVGERDPRSEDRQLLLDALCAAGEHLVVTYAGADERTGAPVPPAVPLGELLDALDRTAVGLDGRRARDVVTTVHPLQPFDERNFLPGALHRPGPFSFDPLARAGAQAALRPRTATAPFLASPLPPRPPADVELADLLRLLEHPARGFLRQRLEVAVTREEEEPADELPVELDALEAWAVGERMLRDRVSGLEPARCKQLELRRGVLPPGRLGEVLATSIGREVEAVVAASVLERETPPGSIDVDVPLGDGTRLTGTVPGVRAEVLLSLTYSRLGPRHRLRAWVQLLALTASAPAAGWRAVAVGRAASGAARSVLGPLGYDDARSALLDLVALHRDGLRTPLPLPLKTAAAYAEKRHRGMRPEAALATAEQKWRDSRFPGEQSDAEHVLVYGAGAPVAAVVGAQPWHPWRTTSGEAGAFGELARRLWTPLLDEETRVRP
ncbi:DNA helicase/exodeoxyribonuclease V gamma subunit [Motilibacter peucedani]|uniref:RecBCD enzyme subunit RecC n=1 Tax=Motilibacter peucedani TaxID=598650 RepID=A0A420XRE3_9ACTN|nr:exodeoxyribonuclease V subunit gamma [Motilibacter peucedani]RKS77455.1 DNA helicase/exodeoxyribonuclease V gamma subunit [Motilibacter peucedani]